MFDDIPVAYYNENDPFAAAWLEQLINADLIMPGWVDTRSIEDVAPEDLDGFTQCHFFAGIGGWSYALRLAGWPDERPVWTGSCPCQPYSAAGKGTGFADERHLWPSWFHLIEQCEPSVVLGEQVTTAIAHGWLDRVQSDLEGAGYAVGAHGIAACSVGAPHQRKRLYFVGESDANGREPWWIAGEAVGYGSAFDSASGVGSLDHSPSPRRNGSRQGTEAEARNQARLRGPEPGRGDGGLADAESRRKVSVQQQGQRGVSEQDGRLVLPTSEQVGIPRCPWEPRSAVGDPDQLGPQGRSLGGHGPDELPARSPSLVNGFWSDAEWLWCRDSKYRPVEPGTFPLVAGLSKGMVRGCDPGEPINPQASPEARVGRLRGYGNSIVPQVAAEFISTYMSL